MIHSKIITAEIVDNERREFGSTLRYYPAYVVYSDCTVPALFTRAQLDVAIDRARSNPEDVPPMFVKPKPFWRRLVDWFNEE